MSSIITTSWDDGHPLDFKIASLLEEYNLKGTFYIPKANCENLVMEEEEIISLSLKHEIGGHTLNHNALNSNNVDFLENEIGGCKKWLEKLLDKECKSFCYPKGKYSNLAVNTVKKNGFKYARTVELININNLQNSFLVPTAIQVYKHNRFTYFKNSVKRSGVTGITNFIQNVGFKNNSLDYLTNKMLDNIEERGGVFHLWGHSWEIEKENLWQDLEVILKICSQRTNFIIKNNGELSD